MDMKYRYMLWRNFQPRPDGRKRKYVNFIMLNPSTADEMKNDPTVERCCRRAVRMGFDGVFVTNLFAFRSTDPGVMLAAEDPIGFENDYWIRTMAVLSELVICAWGKDGSHGGRSKNIAAMLRSASVELYCFKVSAATGQPCHPLYLSYQLQPQVWERKS